MSGSGFEAASGFANWTWLLRAVLLAVLLFWVVGAYNRLTRLRSAIGAAWGQIDEQLARRAAALDSLLELVREPLADEVTTLSALAAAQERQQQAARAVRAKPHLAAALQAWQLAESELASPLARLQALLEHRRDFEGAEAVRPLIRQLVELVPRMSYARQGFNDAAAAYNAAVAEFPTRLLQRPFGFRPTASL